MRTGLINEIYLTCSHNICCRLIYLLRLHKDLRWTHLRLILLSVRDGYLLREVMCWDVLNNGLRLRYLFDENRLLWLWLGLLRGVLNKYWLSVHRDIANFILDRDFIDLRPLHIPQRIEHHIIPTCPIHNRSFQRSLLLLLLLRVIPHNMLRHITPHIRVHNLFHNSTLLLLLCWHLNFTIREYILPCNSSETRRSADDWSIHLTLTRKHRLEHRIGHRHRLRRSLLLIPTRLKLLLNRLLSPKPCIIPRLTHLRRHLPLPNFINPNIRTTIINLTTITTNLRIIIPHRTLHRLITILPTLR